MSSWMMKAAVVLALLVFLSVHGVSIYLVVSGSITGEQYMAAWSNLASTALGGLLLKLGAATASTSPNGGQS